MWFVWFPTWRTIRLRICTMGMLVSGFLSYNHCTFFTNLPRNSYSCWYEYSLNYGPSVDFMPKVARGKAHALESEVCGTALRRLEQGGFSGRPRRAKSLASDTTVQVS